MAFCKYVFAGVGPRLKVAAISVWDYAHGDGKALNERAYGKELADHFDKHYREAIGNRWLPDYAQDALEDGHHGGPQPGQLARLRRRAGARACSRSSTPSWR